MTLSIRETRSTDPALVERESALAALERALDVAKSGRGGFVLIRGEAGIGKTALVRAFAARSRGIRVVMGSCDGFATPMPFAALQEICPALGGELDELLESGAAYGQVARWIREQLARTGPWIFVVEDVQWADEATLELLVYLARRMEGLTSLLLVTCRDDGELPAATERTLSRLATVPGVRQLPVPRLTRQGVAGLAAGTGLDVDALVRLTAGNPLFVHEVLENREDAIPISIRDAIRARIAALDRVPRRALEAAAVAGSHAEPWLVAALSGEDVVGIDECIRRGFLTKADALAFAHELTRMIVLEQLPVFRSIALHRRALEVLRAAGSTDTARLAHHAEAAADAAAVVEFATAAGLKAEAMSSLREAAVQFRRALRFAGGVDAAQRAELLEHLAHVVYLRNELAEAYELAKEAVALRRAGDVDRLALSLSSLAQIARLNNRGDEAWALAREAVALVEPFGDSVALASGYNMLGRLGVGAGLHEETRTYSGRALEMGRRIGDAEAQAVALASLGSVALNEDDRSGVDLLEESLALAREAGLAEAVDRALNNLGVGSTIIRDFQAATEYFERLEEFGARSEIVRCSIDEPRAEIALALGDWDEAERYGLAGRSARDPVDRALSCLVLARLAIRRGTDPDPYLAPALQVSREVDTTQIRWPLLLCRAERAWLAGTLAELEPDLRREYAVARRQSDRWAMGAIGRWLWLLGSLSEYDERAPLPYRLEVAGDVAAAVREWDRFKMPFEKALCLAASGDVKNLHAAHAEFFRLGAAAFATQARMRIHDLGGAMPRAPRTTTRGHPSGLTSREAEIAALLAEGLSNDEIADRLVLSTRTVAHHVSAVLGKLGLERRSQVAAALR